MRSYLWVSVSTFLTHQELGGVHGVRREGDLGGDLLAPRARLRCSLHVPTVSVDVLERHHSKGRDSHCRRGGEACVILSECEINARGAT